jgi:agmatinase
MDSGLALVGLPSDRGSSHLRGAAGGPAAIRAALRSGASNMFAENGVDIDGGLLIDAGDLALDGTPAEIDAIAAGVGRLLDAGHRVIALGGDHAVTYPVLRAYGSRHRDLSILHFDAHPDLYDSYDGDPYSHASPFARIMEEGLARRLVQVGIRASSPDLRRQAERFGVVTVSMDDLDELPARLPTGPVYVSVDLDALDPAFAPGVSHHEPGGLTTREVISAIKRLQGPIVGADIVELNPLRDLNEMTAVVAAKFVRELAGAMLRPVAV